MRFSLWLWSALISLVYASYTYPPVVYRALDERDNQFGTPCNGSYTFTEATANISDGCNPRYNQNMICSWNINPNQGSITLSFRRFNLETGYDFLNITDGNQLLGVFTGNKLPPSVTSTTGIFNINFITDGTSHGRGFGFNTTQTGFDAYYHATACPNACSGHGTCQAAKTSPSEVGTGNRCQCEDGWWGGDCSYQTCVGTTISSEIEGALMDWERSPNDWNTRNSTANNLQDCRWVITPSVIEAALTLKFWTFDLEKGRDFLWVYDGDSGDSPLIAQLSSNDEWSNNSLGKRQLPLIKSKSGKLFLHYQSDAMSFRNGFYASWSTLQRCSEYCKYGSCIDEECVCQEGRYGGDCSSNFCTGSTYLTNRTGAITDHAGISNYQGYADCRWYVTPAVPVNFITMRFTHFTLEGGHDFLYVHDGMNETAPLEMLTYVYNRTIDSAMTGDGLSRVAPYIGDVEPYVNEQHVVMYSLQKAVYLHLKTDMNDNNITIKYPGLLDTSNYGIGQKIGFRMEYEGVFCAGIRHIYLGNGTMHDGSGPHHYHGGQRCLWILHPPTCQITGRENALPRPYDECADDDNATSPHNFKHRVLEMSFDLDIHNSDTLRVLDGNNTDANLLQSFHNVTGKNIKVTSVHHTVMLEFVTDGEYHGQGFNITWHPVTTSSIALPGTIAPYPSVQQFDGNVTNRPPGLEAKTLCDGTKWLYDLTNKFTDHVLPSITYRNHMYCQWNIELPSYVQQQEWWVDRLDMHPGKVFAGVNTSGLSQSNVIQVGPANHTDADFVTLYKGRHEFEPYEQSLINGFAENETQAIARWTGYMKFVERTPAAVPNSPVPMLTLNGTRAFAVFRSSSQYVDLGFQMRYQAVISDPQLCETWGRGYGDKAEGEVNKAVQITLRTARWFYPHMVDWRENGPAYGIPTTTGGVLPPNVTGNQSDPKVKWYMTQGGAKFKIQIHHKQTINGTFYHEIVPGNYEDLNTGYYMLSFKPKLMGTSEVDIMMYGPNGLEHINGSPYMIKIHTGPTEPQGCRIIGAKGDGSLNVNEGQVILPMQNIIFRIQAGDAYTNHRDHGGDQFVVKLDGANPVAGVVKDMYDGTYNASFQVNKAGTYSVFVGISYLEKYETAIYGSPFTIIVPKIECPGGVAPDSCSGASNGECLDNGVCDCKGAFTGSDCSVDLIQPYRDAILIENIILGALIFFYGGYLFWTSNDMKDTEGMLDGLDDEDDEEVQFQGFKCCMHW